MESLTLGTLRPGRSHPGDRPWAGTSCDDVVDLPEEVLAVCVESGAGDDGIAVQGMVDCEHTVQMVNLVLQQLRHVGRERVQTTHSPSPVTKRTEIERLRRTRTSSEGKLMQ